MGDATTLKQTLLERGDVFDDFVIASAIIDSVLHHAISVSIKDESYLLKAKYKAVLLTNHVEIAMGDYSIPKRGAF